MDGQERARVLLAALRAFLIEESWSIDSVSGDGNGLVARFGEGAGVTFVFGTKAQPAASGLTVQVHDDNSGFEKREDWQQLQWIASNAGRSDVVHCRLGRDLIFAFKDKGGVLSDYEKSLQQRFREMAMPELDRSVDCACLILKHEGRTRARPISVSGIVDYTVRANADSLIGEERWRNALIAVNGCIAESAMDQAHFVISQLVLGHLNRFAKGGWITCLPLFLSGDEIRVHGLDGAVRDAFWAACRRSYSQSLYRLLVQLGFLHLYIANGEQLRSDQDFDPNTRFITEILAACEGDGRFTLTCARDFVFHSGAPAPEVDEAAEGGSRWELGSLRTLGQRFFLAEIFCIIDFGARRLEHFRLLSGYAEAKLDRHTEQISRLSGSRCSPEEARLALRNLAFRQIDREAGILARADLSAVAEGVLTDMRRRPAHVAFVEEAIAQSELLRQVGAGRFAFRDGIVRDHLTATAIGRGLRYALLVGSFDKLRRAFSRRIVDTSVFEMACDCARLAEMPDIGAAIRTIPAAFMLNEGPSSDIQIQAENAIRFLFAAADFLAAARPEVWRDRRAFFDHLCKDAGPVVLAGMALPQFTFRDISLKRWTLQNCNLRSCVFVGCDLSQMRALDSFLGGCVIKDCIVDEYIKLAESNLSGSWIGGNVDTRKLFNVLGSLRDRFKRSNWTLSSVGGNGLDGDTIDDVFAFLSRQDASMVSLTLHDSNGAAPHSAPSPPEFQAALLQNVWGDDVVVDDVDSQRGFVRRADAARLARPGAPEAIKWIARAAFCGEHGRRGLLAIDAAGELWFAGPSDDGGSGWRKASLPEPLVGVERFDAFDEDEFDPTIRAAAVVVEKGERRLVLFEADVAAAPDLSFAATRPRLHLTTRVTASAWVRERRDRAPSFYVGYKSGAVERIALSEESGEWESRIRVRPGEVGVGGLSFARRSKVLVVAYRNGLTIGLQSAADPDAPPLFSFKTALVRIYDIVYLEGSGDQMILVGSTSVAGQKADPLCILFNAAGDVLAVFPNPPPLPAGAKELELPGCGSAPGGAPGAAADNQDVIDDLACLQERVDAVRLDRSRAEVRPLSDNELNRGLVFKLRSTAGKTLQAAIDTPDGPAFRHLHVTLTAAARDGSDVTPVQRHFTDRELEFLPSAAAEIEVRVPVAFSRDTETAQARLDLRYRSGGVDVARKPFDVEIDVLWRENPYEASGKAALGSRFFGRLTQIENCAAQLSRGNGVIVRAARRMGKSSFLASVAQRLSNQGHLAVVLSLAGSAKPRAELAALIVRGAQDVLSPVAPATAERLQKELSRSAVKGRQALDRFAELARAMGFKTPAVALIDEWGVISNRASALFDEPFEQEIGELVQNATANTPITVCLASAPDDFVYRDSSHQSDFYRGFDNRSAWLDLGPLNDEELRLIMTEPIQGRAGRFSDEEATFEILRRLSSGDPYGANIIMARAYERALARANAANGGDLEVRPEDLDNELVIRDLVSIYDVHLPYTFERLSVENQRRTVEEAAAPVPAWEQRSIAVPRVSDDPHQRGLFSGAGFRRSRDPGMRDARFDLWIPRGFALNIARQRIGSSEHG